VQSNRNLRIHMSQFDLDRLNKIWFYIFLDDKILRLCYVLSDSALQYGNPNDDLSKDISQICKFQELVFCLSYFHDNKDTSLGCGWSESCKVVF
jgi:hypothetical protein